MDTFLSIIDVVLWIILTPCSFILFFLGYFNWGSIILFLDLVWVIVLTIRGKILKIRIKKEEHLREVNEMKVRAEGLRRRSHALAKKIWLIRRTRISFYSSETFYSLKASVASFISDYETLKIHINELQDLIILTFRSLNNPNAGIDSVSYVNFNTGSNTYARGNLSNSYSDFQNRYYCSLPVLKNARENPYKYICKYFEIPISEITLAKLEAVSQAIENIEQGLRYLRVKQDNLKSLLSKEHLGRNVPDLLLSEDMAYFNRCIGFDLTFNLNSAILPTFSFEYISAGGNSGQSFGVKMTADVILDFMFFIHDELERKSRASYVRSLVTPKVRSQVKERDNFTCQICGISTKDEPHLLLEIDHIIPVSKGGTSDMSNLQTLCWKCNRSKSNKL